MTNVNQEVFNQIQSVATTEGISLDATTESRLLTTKIDAVKKFWAAGTDQNNQRVLLKIRPLHSVINKEEFISSELRQKDIADTLAAAGVPAQRVLKTQFEVEPEWIIREFREGLPIGKMSVDESIDQEKLFEDLKDIRRKLDTIDLTAIPGIHTGINWQEKWQIEYFEREKFIKKYLGENAAAKIKTIFENISLGVSAPYAIHNDLAPQNILRDQNDYFIIDWGEMASGPRAIDWATVWSFAISHAELRALIYNQAINESGSEVEKEITHNVFILLGARLLSSIAEYQDYRQNIAQSEGDFAYLPQAWKNYQELLARV